MPNFKIGQKVRFKNPEKGEENIVFRVLEVHERDGNIPEKIHVEMMCEMPIKPVFCYFSNELTD